MACTVSYQNTFTTRYSENNNLKIYQKSKKLSLRNKVIPLTELHLFYENLFFKYLSLTVKLVILV